MKNYLLIPLLVGTLSNALAQSNEADSSKTMQSHLVESREKLCESDTSNSKIQQSSSTKFIPNPRKAALLSAILPAGGQFYNRDYWKVPLVLAGLAAGVWTATYWHIRYNDFVEGYFSFYDLTDKNLKTYGKLKAGLNEDSRLPVFYRGGVLNGKREEAKALDINQVRKIKNDYRRYFETSVIAVAAIYTLAIIEANVAAHLKTFDISDDLTFRISPKFSQPMITQPVPGLRIVISMR